MALYHSLPLHPPAPLADRLSFAWENDPMTQDELFDQALGHMEATLASLEKRVPAAQRVPYKTSFVFRYVEQTIHQAIVQKLARLVSGLHAARILLERGFVQEQGALQRMIDEFREDIMFLSLAVVRGDVTPLHQEYLAAFYKEEFDHEDPHKSTQRRPMVSRKRIRTYLAKVEGSDVDPSTAAEVSRTLSKGYSGYVHAASPHIMEMYGGNPARFHVRGMHGTPRQDEHRDDFWNYVYRGILAFAFVAMAFGDRLLLDSFRKLRDEFDRQSDR